MNPDNLPLVKQLARRLGENLNYTIRVGLTHWDESQGDGVRQKVGKLIALQ